VQDGVEKKMLISMLKEVLLDLKYKNDIKGAALVEGEDTILACDFPENLNPKTELMEIMDLLNDLKKIAKCESSNDLFMQYILDYGDHLIMARDLMKNLTLLVMMQRQGYLSLATLDLENSSRKITELLENNKIINYGE
jgi:predicted regulator of Ras-like GTPase activity (Roadblock/LC7/MglB family)